METLRVALPKGRLSKTIIPRFQEAGYTITEANQLSGNCSIDFKGLQITLVWLRSRVIANLVAQGYFHIGFTGTEAIQEHYYSLWPHLCEEDMLFTHELDWAKPWQVSLLGKDVSDIFGQRELEKILIATDYRHIAKAFYPPVTIVNTEGNSESMIPPCHAAIAVVQSGETAKRLGLNFRVPLLDYCQLEIVNSPLLTSGDNGTISEFLRTLPIH